MQCIWTSISPIVLHFCLGLFPMVPQNNCQNSALQICGFNLKTVAFCCSNCHRGPWSLNCPVPFFLKRKNNGGIISSRQDNHGESEKVKLRIIFKTLKFSVEADSKGKRLTKVRVKIHPLTTKSDSSFTKTSKNGRICVILKVKWWYNNSVLL